MVNRTEAMRLVFVCVCGPSFLASTRCGGVVHSLLDI